MSIYSKNWSPRYLLAWASSALVGVAAAVATVIVLDYVRESPNESTVHAEGSSKASQKQKRFIRTVVVDRTDSTKLEELERRIQELDEAEGADEPEAPFEAPDPEAVQRELAEEFANLDQQHVDDPRDPSWSPEAERNLAFGLTALGEDLGFSVDATECKTTSCRASLSWRDYESAREMGRDLVETSFAGLNCTQKVWLERPEDPAAPYRAQLYFNCSEQRAGLVEVE
jgi:hypothetical protein